MSSEQEESADHLDESNANCSANVDQSFDQKGNGLKEHAKPRRRRRGKKRKQKKASAATCEAENLEECESELLVDREHENHVECESPAWNDENLSCDYGEYSDIILRPINVPSAPMNSTQFIMDDHADCRFYMSFETPNPYGVSSHAYSQLNGEEGDIIEQPIGDDAAYIDIDYQYESPQDFDNTAYCDKEFELSYKNNRFEDLMRFSRNQLIERLQSVESRIKELNEDLVKEDPNTILEKLQAELLELQEKNSYLKDVNSNLNNAFQDESDISETLTSQTLTEGISVSSTVHYVHESDGEIYVESSEPPEVVMSDLNANSPKDICDKNCDLQIHSNECSIGGGDLQSDHSEVSGGLQCSDHNEVYGDLQSDHNEVYGDQQSDLSEVDCDQQSNHNEIESDQCEHCEVDDDQQIDHYEVNSEQKTDCNDMNSDNFSKESKSEECMSSCTKIINSEDTQTKHILSNSRIIHCQPNNLVNDDLRPSLSMNISTDLFHLASQSKCSSLIPLEGGMSPSETSVN